MSLLFSLVGFCVQLVIFASVVSIVVSCVSLPQSDVDDDVNESDATLPMTTSYCAKSIVPTSYTISIDEPTVFAYDYSTMTVRELKALCKSQGFKRYSSLRKHELIALLSEF